MANGIANKVSRVVERFREEHNSKKDFRSTLVCRNIDIGLNLFENHANFRIAHLTDMHVGRVTPIQAQQAAVSLVNDSSPDLVLLTGDFVCHSDLFLEDLSSVLARLNAPAFAVLGNHDHWTNAPAVKLALKRARVEVLENANTTIVLGGSALQLVGLDDAYTHHDDVNKAVRGLTAGIPTIGLSHIAESAEQLWEHSVDLVLSGHTHAGQITVAGLNELILGKIGGHKYIHGLYENLKRGSSNQSVYVGAGVGSAVIPFRVGEKAKREVTIFNLKVPL